MVSAACTSAAAMASSLGQMATTWELGEETGERRFDTFLVDANSAPHR